MTRISHVVAAVAEAVAVMAGERVDRIEDIPRDSGCGASTVKNIKEIPLIDLTQSSEE